MGACVDTVASESNTTNQCSTGVQITVTILSQTFADVIPSHTAYTYVEALATNNIATGCGGGNFCLEQIATRDLAAIWLWKAKNNPLAPPVASGAVYNDVPDGHFAEDWIRGLKVGGYTEGCDASNYCPEEGLTLAGFAKLVAKTFGLAP